MSTPSRRLHADRRQHTRRQNPQDTAPVPVPPTPTPVPPTPTPPTPTPPATGSFPNQPSTFALISDYQFPTAVPNAQYGDFPDGSGWRVVGGDSGNAKTSGGVLTITDPAGFGGGSAPAMIYVDSIIPSTTRKLYAGFGLTISSPWQGHPTGVNKILNAWMTNSMMWLVLYGSAAPYQLKFAPEFAASWNYNPVSATPSVALGTRHLVEWLLDADAGTCTWWLDGVQQGTWKGTFPSGPFTMVQLDPCWGGLGGTVTAAQYMAFDHVRLAGAA